MKSLRYKLIIGSLALLLVAGAGSCLLFHTRDQVTRPKRGTNHPIVDTALIGKLYDFPVEELVVIDILEEEKERLKRETESKRGYEADAIAAYLVESKQPYGFMHLKITIMTEREYADKKIKEFWAGKRKIHGKMKEFPEGLEKELYIKRTNAALKTFRGIKRGKYIEGGISRTDIAPGLVLECRDKKKKINVRIVQFDAMQQHSSDSQGEPPYELRVVTGGEKYFEIWEGNGEEVDFNWAFDYLRRADFYHILTTINNSVLDAIYESDIVEKYYADKKTGAGTSKPPKTLLLKNNTQ
jgi:hypothetical protein